MRIITASKTFKALPGAPFETYVDNVDNPKVWIEKQSQTSPFRIVQKYPGIKELGFTGNFGTPAEAANLIDCRIKM